MATAGQHLGRRVLVYLQQGEGLTAARFSQCLLEHFGFQDYGNVGCSLEGDKFVLHKVGPAGPALEPARTALASGTGHKLQHPPFCPLTDVNNEEKADIPEEISERGIDVAVAIILATSDEHVLLTRRPQHMRTFPGVWVPPGGHVELGETLTAAGLRELMEETGLTFQPGAIQSNILCMWESVFPPVLPLGSPKRHHVVVYIVVSSSESWKDLQRNIKLDPMEVEACVWMSKDMIRTVIDGEKRTFSSSHTFTVVSPDSQQEEHPFDPNLLYILNRATGFDTPRISTGSKFALSEWLDQVDAPSGKYKL